MAFFEFIANRDTETTKLGADWKYLIVRNIVSNPSFVAMISTDQRASLTAYAANGAFYSKREARVEDPIRQSM